MKIERIRIDAFGGVRDLDTGDDPLGGLTVIEGRNEAGKSTFFEWIATLLYGFAPATRDAHPYSPWDGTNAEGGATLRLSEGAAFEVRRRLLSSPAGTIVRGDISEELRNHTLSAAEHVPATIFRQVFALRLSELASLEGAGWEAVQDRLLGALGAGDIRPTREVVEELDSEASSLWRTSRRGNQEIRALDEERETIRRERAEAEAEEREIRETADRLDRTRSRLDEARAERIEARAFIERYNSLGSVRDHLERISDYRDTAGDAELLKSLPSDPAEALGRLRESAEDAQARIERLEKEIREPIADIEAFDIHAQTVLAREGELTAFLRRASKAEQSRLRRAQLEQERRDLRRRLETGVLNAFGRPWDDELSGPISNLPVARIRDAMERFRTHDRPDAEEVVPEGLIEEVRMGVLPPAAIAMLVVGVIGVVVALVIDSPTWLLLPGTLLASVGGTRLWNHHQAFQADEKRRAEYEARRRRAEELRRKRESARAEAQVELEKWLAPLIEDFEPADLFPELPAELTRFQELLRDDWDRREEIETISRELGRLEQEAADLAALDESLSLDAAGLAHDLPGLIRDANALQQAATAAEREKGRLETQISDARSNLAETESRIGEIESRLADAGDGDADRGLALIQERLDAHRRADQLEDELERRHPDLADIRARIAAAEASGEDWTVDPESIERERAREQELTDEIEHLQGEVQRLDSRISQLGGRTRVDELAGRLEELAERRDRLVRQRDRLFVMARLVQEAERRVREEHQPDILRDAGRMLERLTGGRYDRILLGDRDGRGFRIRGPASPNAVPVEHPISTGTREQIYLALRLAILDHLDRGGERLPLVLDEVFVNWDPIRRAAGIELLAEVAQSRQVFFFTCHPSLADEVAEVASSRVLLEVGEG